MNGQGLAAQGPMIDRNMVAQVKAMLVQGVSPEQLMQQGVPREVIEIAMQEIQVEAQQTNNGGLAGMNARQVQMA